MLLQAVQVRPARAGILADKQARRFDPRVDAPAPDGEAPAGSDRRLALGSRARGSNGSTLRAEVARRPHRRPEPLVAAGGVDRAGLGIANDMIERPVLAIGPTRLPAFAGRKSLSKMNAPFLVPMSARTFSGIGRLPS